ncbi:MAG: AAA family ATPase, partial [Coprobacillus sp.]|nr:AAA family ATPase [Coprobacillus sp.]
METHIIKRDEYLNKLVEKMDNGLIKVITGLRRSGKTFLLFTIFKDYLLSKGVDPASIISISMEGYGNKKYRDSEYFYNYVSEYIKGGGHYYLFVDEVGLLNDYEEVINGLNLPRSIDIYITGSNAYSLSSDIITTFRGRSDQIYLSPLSFKEYYSSTSDMGKKEALEEYLDYGGLPKLKEYPSYDSKKAYLESIYKEAYLRDVKERHHIRNDNNIEILINILASTSGSLVNLTNIQKAYLERGKVSIKVNTIRKYLK